MSLSGFGNVPYGGALFGGGQPGNLFPAYLEVPNGWQPWNIASQFVVSYWDNETIQGTAALVANVISTNDSGVKTWLKVWMPSANVQPLG